MATSHDGELALPPLPPPDAPADDWRGLGPPLGPEATGMRADGFLAKHFPFFSRSQWRQGLEMGAVRRNGAIIRPSQKLRCGDRLTIYHPLAAEPVADERIRLLDEAPGLLAIYKPATLPMHESGSHRRRTFGALVASRFGPEWAPLHRLDRETSGVVLCAADLEVKRRLGQDWANGRVKKTYDAIVLGSPPWEHFTEHGAIALDPQSAKPRYCVAPQGVSAATELTVVSRQNSACLIEARPVTGRTNQIRVHLAHLGLPIVGDKVYGPASERGRPMLERHALHARAIEVRLPYGGRSFSAMAPWGDDLSAIWQAFAPGGATTTPWRGPGSPSHGSELALRGDS